MQILVANNRTGAAADAERKPLEGEPTLEPNPLISAEEMEEGHEAAAVAYRYRKVRTAAAARPRAACSVTRPTPPRPVTRRLL